MNTRTVSYNSRYNRIEIRFEFNEELVALVKTIPDRRYHQVKAGKFWSVPATPFHAAEAVKVLADFQIEQKVKALAGEFETAVKPVLKAKKVKGLYPFQAAGVEFLKRVRGRAILADEMGLGKTVQALAYLRETLSPKTKILIVTPASVLYKWQEESVKWLGEEWSPAVAEGTKGALPNNNPVIMSYRAATTRYLDIAKWGPGAIIFDEVHYLKNNNTQRAKSARLFSAAVPIMIGLSGTPFLNRPLELFNILNMLDERAWKSFWDYARRYCGAVLDKYGHWDFRGATNQEELARRLQPIMVRRLKSEVLEQLPSMSRVILPVVTQQREYKEIANNRELNSLAKLTLLRQAVGKAKAPVAVEWAENFMDSQDEKLVIYAHHKDVVTTMKDGLEKYHPLVIDGSVSNKQRQELVHKFQTLPKYRVMIISSAGGEGIDLFRASNILFVEREWSPLYEEQVEARLHRMGQKNAVTAYYLAALNTIDEKLADLVDSKREVFHTIIGGDSIETLVKRELLKELK
jgi:SWI/SNF-related matrix-associated actin-dependent regulator 1 of chromatin subfamily A